MDCNRDEALGARKIAEKKFTTKDIAGAKKFTTDNSNIDSSEVWATYDNEDGMPRFYALIQKVLSLMPFKLHINFVNSKSNSELGPMKWVASGFAKTCGDFRVGRYVVSNTVNIFSHSARFEKGPHGIVKFLPRKAIILVGFHHSITITNYGEKYWGGTEKALIRNNSVEPELGRQELMEGIDNQESLSWVSLKRWKRGARVSTNDVLGQGEMSMRKRVSILGCKHDMVEIGGAAVCPKKGLNEEVEGNDHCQNGSSNF
ncbi:uncharacterized protein A4U43_C05F15190 [Asparagus officinalis]|uniref:DUF3444 domain-containing protein n=1 Tax=Asparagus officinalis TaxID=4686 RepID=A0A5P1EVG8_ASPOF|nr:uncharacterized protein A4U43_C05F15190 [Asparagus officinalis]